MYYDTAIAKINEARHLASEEWCTDGDWDRGWDAGMCKAIDILLELQKGSSKPVPCGLRGNQLDYP